jgi:hypothetical protein
MIDAQTFHYLVSSFGIIIGGGWVIWKFSIQREAHPKVEFDLECEVIGSQDRKKIIQITACLHNKGSVRHKIDGNEFYYKIRYLLHSDKVSNGYEISAGKNDAQQGGKDEKIKVNQTRFKTFEVNGIKRSRWAPRYEYTFIDPGVVQRYRSVVALPENVDFIVVRSYFKYIVRSCFKKKRPARDQHSVQRIFNIRRKPGENAEKPNRRKRLYPA